MGAHVCFQIGAPTDTNLVLPREFLRNGVFARHHPSAERPQPDA